MIEINEQKIGKTNHKVFTLLNDGFNGVNGWVEMECRLSDMKYEGEAFFITVSDDKVCKNGDFAPLEMDKPELKQFIDYLNKSYEAMPQHYLQRIRITVVTELNINIMQNKFKELANGKSSKDCTFEEQVDVYLSSKKKDETWEERKARINVFRCGWQLLLLYGVSKSF